MLVGDELLSRVRHREASVKSTGSNGWYTLPNCLKCGRKRSMHFSPTRGYVCHGCHASGGTWLLNLLLHESGFDVPHPRSTRMESPVLGDLSVSAEPAPAPKADVDMPVESILCTCDVPEMLMPERGLPKEFLLSFEPRFCVEGRYGGRALFPISTGGRRAFFAYNNWREMRPPKVLYPSGLPMGDFIFPYDHVLRNYVDGEPVVVVEGPLNALRILYHRRMALKTIGWPLSFLGQAITERRLELLEVFVRRGAEIVIAFDSDVAPSKAARTLGGAFGRDVVSAIDWTDITSLCVKKERQLRDGTSPDKKLDPDDVWKATDWVGLMAARKPAGGII